jgi:hypothetical protein
MRLTAADDDARDGGSIPLRNLFADTYPGAELILTGVEEPLALSHAATKRGPGGDSRDGPDRALFLQRFAAPRG